MPNELTDPISISLTLTAKTTEDITRIVGLCSDLAADESIRGLAVHISILSLDEEEPVDLVQRETRPERN
jgi:hypothetical protein